MSGEGIYLYDGKEFRSLGELPPEAGELYKKYNVNGLLDFYRTSFQKDLKTPPKFEIGGKRYNSLEEMPLDLKEKILDRLALLERQGLRLIINEDQTKRVNQPKTIGGPTKIFSEAPVAEVSSALRYKLILGLVILAIAIFFIYIFISSYLKNQ
jgi:hypothetical protein